MITRLARGAAVLLLSGAALVVPATGAMAQTGPATAVAADLGWGSALTAAPAPDLQLNDPGWG